MPKFLFLTLFALCGCNMTPQQQAYWGGVAGQVADQYQPHSAAAYQERLDQWANPPIVNCDSTPVGGTVYTTCR